jgi:hypothetical protein
MIADLQVIGGNAIADQLEERLLAAPVPGMRTITADDLPAEHFFAPGLYARSLFRPAGTLIVGHAHRHSHLAIVLHGRLRVLVDGKVREIVGPSKPFLTEGGVRKATFAMEDTTLITFHPTDKTDLDELEEELIDKSPAFIEAKRSGQLESLRTLSLSQ